MKYCRCASKCVLVSSSIIRICCGFVQHWPTLCQLGALPKTSAFYHIATRPLLCLLPALPADLLPSDIDRSIDWPAGQWSNFSSCKFRRSNLGQGWLRPSWQSHNGFRCAPSVQVVHAIWFVSLVAAQPSYQNDTNLSGAFCRLFPNINSTWTEQACIRQLSLSISFPLSELPALIFLKRTVLSVHDILFEQPLYILTAFVHAKNAPTWTGLVPE